MYHRLRNHFGYTRWNSKMTGVKWKLVLVSLDIVLILTLDRCTICAKRAIGSKLFWVYLIELLGDIVEVEARFALLGEGVNLVAK
jgi:hypothetical protein